MKKSFVSLVVLLFLTMNGYMFFTQHSSNENEINTSEWGKPFKGVQAQLFTAKSSYSLVDNIELEVRLRNNSRKLFILNKAPYKTVNMKYNGKAYADAIGEENISNADLVIPPGETKEFKIMVISTDQGEGRYEFSGGLDGIELPELDVTVHKK